MKLTPQQAHVLANLDRVVPRAAKICSVDTRSRYQLDEKECTAQITSLIISKLIAKHSSGGFQRLGATKSRESSVAERQTPLAGSIEAIRAALSLPETVRKIGAERQARNSPAGK